MLWLFGPAMIGTYEPFSQNRLDLQIVIRLPGRRLLGENRSINAGECSLTVAGSPAGRLDGTFGCTNMSGVGGTGVEPAVINVKGTFSASVEPAASATWDPTCSPEPPAPDDPNAVDVVADHVEVVQVVQDAATSIPLVGGKSTVARVFGRINGADDPGLLVTGRLIGCAAGLACREQRRC